MSVGVGALKVVARFREGTLLKGSTQDFFPKKESFHVQVEGRPGEPLQEVEVSQLKALFFVKTFEGDPQHQSPESLDGATGSGRKMLVTFEDGEQMLGFTMGYNPQAAGFFLIPADAESNNERVFVVNAAVTSIDWV